MMFFQKAKQKQLTTHIIKTGKKKERGFTLIEIIIVITILSIVSLSIRPIYTEIIVKSKESALRKNLYMIREAIDSYYTDHIDENNSNYYPEKLTDLVTEEYKYLRYIPEDPFTGKKDWTLIYVETDSLKRGIYDIKSNYPLVGSNGILYKDW